MLTLWPFPLGRNYPTNPDLTRLFFRFAECGDLAVSKAETHWITVSGSIGSMRFWDANKYYAWANQGEFTTPDGNRAVWIDEMPSRAAVRAMRKAISASWLRPRPRFTLPAAA